MNCSAWRFLPATPIHQFTHCLMTFTIHMGGRERNQPRDPVHMGRKRGPGVGTWSPEGSVQCKHGSDFGGSTGHALQGSPDGGGRDRFKAPEPSKSDPWRSRRPRAAVRPSVLVSRRFWREGSAISRAAVLVARRDGVGCYCRWSASRTSTRRTSSEGAISRTTASRKTVVRDGTFRPRSSRLM
jgi:hypothetical protein